EAEQVRRIRNGAAKREKAQNFVMSAPDVLNGIMVDPRQSAKHRIDSAKALDDLAEGGPRAVHGDSGERVIIHIDMGADLRAKGLASDPADVVHIEAEVQPNSTIDGNWDSPKQIVAERPMIEADSQFDQQEPVKRGPGRPKGSRNKPKDELVGNESRPRCVPGFDI